MLDEVGNDTLCVYNVQLLRVAMSMGAWEAKSGGWNKRLKRKHTFIGKFLSLK